MRKSRTIDVSTGLFVLLGIAAILFLVTQITNREFSLRSDSYRVQAQFENVGGLKAGAPVSMAGVTVGRVESIGYDMNLFKAIVTLRIDSRYDRIPNDSDASILTAGLLGGQYIGISPGGSEESFKDGDRVEFVQDAIVLENLISKYLFNQAGERGAAEPDAADRHAGHLHRRAGLEAADVLELRLHTVRRLAERELAVRDLRRKERDGREAEQHEQAGGYVYGTGMPHGRLGVREGWP
jgi:phospholipid/cholesterol/gamma-HCH transport system substrate-binding protein